MVNRAPIECAEPGARFITTKERPWMRRCCAMTKSPRKTGRPLKHPDERRCASTRTDLTLAEKQELSQEARIQGISEAEYVRRRLGFGAPVAKASSPPSIIAALKKQGIDIAELLSRDYISAEAEAAGLDEAAFVRQLLKGAAAPPEKKAQAALISELNGLRLDLKAVGNLANQIALAGWSNRRVPDYWEPARDRVLELGNDVEGCLERLLEDDD